LTLDLGMKAEDKGLMFHIRKVDMIEGCKPPAQRLNSASLENSCPLDELYSLF
jgi:hypothetical protein